MRDHETNEKHAIGPEPGDFWHEMFSPILVVLEVTPDTVVFCRRQEQVGRDRWRWNATLTERLPRDEFSKLLRYQSQAMKHKFYADVIPRGHMPDAEAYALSSQDHGGAA